MSVESEELRRQEKTVLLTKQICSGDKHAAAAFIRCESHTSTEEVIFFSRSIIIFEAFTS